jgi:glycerophosphoryl diester phosphodiesterase
MTLEEFVQKNHRFIAAHRGASGNAPENTLEAFRQAIDCGAKLVEADIQITKDNVPIVFHDDELGRTVSGTGLIAEYTYEELKNFSAGIWFNKKYENEKIPTLDELIELIKGKAFLGLEIKPNNKTLNTARVLLQTLKKHDFVSATVIASFDYLVLKQIKAEYDNSHIAAIKIPGDYVLPSELKKQFSIEAYVCAVDEINDQIVENIKTNNIFWGVYNVDSEEDFQKAIKSGVNAIGTNFPCQMNKLLEKLNGI